MKADFQELVRGAGVLVAVSLLVALGGLVACGSDSPTAPIEQEEVVEVPRVTEMFTGTFGQEGTSFHSIVIAALGATESTVTDLQPVPTLTVGLGIGTEDGAGGCSVFALDTTVKVGETLLSANLEPGAYCVSIFDVGNVFPDATVSYSLQVVHP